MNITTKFIKINKKPKRIAFYSGTFDPVHIGHMTFALTAIKKAKLDELYFLPERVPRNKVAMEHFGHRVAMLKEAIKPYPKMKILELDDKRFEVKKTLPKIEKKFINSKIIFLFGSDKVESIPSWADIELMFKKSELVIGARNDIDLMTIRTLVKEWPTKRVKILKSYAPEVNSSNIRDALLNNDMPEGLLQSVSRYIRQNWLYISLK